MRKIAEFLAMLTLAVLLNGCGVTFVRNGVNPLKGNERVGILVTHRIEAQGTWKGRHISDKLDDQASTIMAELLKDQLRQKGFEAKIIEPRDRVSAIIKRYKELPRNFRQVVSDPDAAELGDLHDLFATNEIDRLLLFEGVSVVRPSALQSFTNAAVSIGLSVALNTVVASSYAPPVSITYTSRVAPDGKFEYYNREQFTKHGDFFSVPDRQGIAENTVEKWTQSALAH